MRHVRTYLAAEPNGLATSWDPPTNFAKLENSPNWLKNPHRLLLENKIRLFSIGCQLFAFLWKFYEGKKSYFGRRVFIFVLPIRNKSPFSGKIITSLKIERMTLNLLAIWLKHKIEMQIIYDGRKVQVWEFVSQGLNIGKWSTGKHCDGVAVVNNVKTIMCQVGGTLPLPSHRRGGLISTPPEVFRR